jgi:hypothetical protein
MKMKIVSFCAAALLAASGVQAQNGQFRAGINLANVSVTDDGRIEEANSLTSFQVGLLGDAKLVGPLFVQSGIIFSGKGSKTQSGNENTTTYYKATTNPMYIEVPANLLFKLPVSTDSKFIVGAGPYVGIGVGGKNKVESRIAGISSSSEKKIEFSNDDPTTTNTEEGAGFGIMRRFDYGLNGTAGIEGKSIVLSVNYGLGLAKLQSGSNSSSDDKNKHRVLSFTVGFKF